MWVKLLSSKGGWQGTWLQGTLATCFLLCSEEGDTQGDPPYVTAELGLQLGLILFQRQPWRSGNWGMSVPVSGGPSPRVPGRSRWEGHIKLAPVGRSGAGSGQTPTPRPRCTRCQRSRAGWAPSAPGGGRASCVTSAAAPAWPQAQAMECTEDGPGSGGLGRSVGQTQFAQGHWAHPPSEVLPPTQGRVVRERGGTSGGWTRVAVAFLASEGRQLPEAKLTSPEAGTP